MECYGNPSIPCWQRNQRTFVFPQIKTLDSQYNTLRRLTYYEQSYCQDIQIYTIFSAHDKYLYWKHRSYRADSSFVISNLFCLEDIFSKDGFSPDFRFLGISRHSRYNILLQNSQYLMFLLSLILEFYLKLFQKQYTSLLKKFS